MLQSDMDSEDMSQLLMDSFDHQMLLECEDIVSIVEWIDRNKTILVLDVDHLLLSYDYWLCFHFQLKYRFCLFYPKQLVR